ncbi:MAG: hypothetical protein ABIQ39_10495 [Ilumatobacteraceae bacterium]
MTLGFWIGHSGAGGGGVVGDTSIVAEVSAGTLDGGVTKPRPDSVCTPWSPFRVVGPGFVGDAPPAPTRLTPDGQTQTLYYRVCDGDPMAAWVGSYTGREIAGVAYDRIEKLLPHPQAAFSPPADSLIVNLETWFAATPAAPVSATASVPGLSSQVTATAVRLEFRSGSTIDTSVIACPPWGSSTGPTNGCTWTPRYPSVQRVTGTTDHRYHGSLTIVWSISWASSDGTSGRFAELRTTTPLRLAVREIQTIGDR